MAQFFYLGAAAAVLKLVLNPFNPISGHVQTIATGSLRDEVSQMREEVDRRRQEIDDLTEDIDSMEIRSYDDLSEHHQRQKKTLATLARRTSSRKMSGYNIGVFGLTSTGKSTMINSLLGKQVAETGVGETTKEMTPYQGTRYTLWDAPGRNDQLIYSDKKYISFIKGLTRRLIVIQYTIKENLDLMRLLDDLGLDYDIVVNKFDDVDEGEQDGFQWQIRREIRKLHLERQQNVFFLSAKYPRMFADWLRMVNYLTEEYSDHHQDSDSN